MHSLSVVNPPVAGGMSAGLRDCQAAARGPCLPVARRTRAHPLPPSLHGRPRSRACTAYRARAHGLRPLLDRQLPACLPAWVQDPTFTLLHFVALLGYGTLSAALEDASNPAVLDHYACLAQLLLRLGHPAHVMDRVGHES